MELLGITPDDRALDSAKLQLRWLHLHFGNEPPRYATGIVLREYAWAYMLALVRSILFLDKSGSHVGLFMLPLLRDLQVVGSFSWGSVVLACLYRELCCATPPSSNQIVEPFILL